MGVPLNVRDSDPGDRLIVIYDYCYVFLHLFLNFVTTFPSKNFNVHSGETFELALILQQSLGFAPQVNKSVEASYCFYNSSFKITITQATL